MMQEQQWHQQLHRHMLLSSCGTCLAPSASLSVAKYSKILSGPLRSRIRFSYLKNVFCLVDSGRNCQDCSKHG